MALASAAAVVATMFVAPREHALHKGASRSNSGVDLAAGAIFPRHIVLDSLIPGVSSPITAGWPVHPL